VDLSLFLISVALWLLLAYFWWRLYIAQRRRARASRIFLDSILFVSATLVLSEMLERVAQRVAQVCVAHCCTIFLLAEDGERLLPSASQGNNDHVDDPVLVNESPEVQQIIREQRPLFIPEASASVLFEHLNESHGIGNVLLVPLVGGGRVVGLMGIDQAEDGREFTTEQVDLAMAIGAQAAAVIEYARLYEQAQHRVAELEKRVTEGAIELAAVNQELESLTYAVSHDLRAPLHRIDGFSRLLLTDCKDRLDETGQEYVQYVRVASQCMKRLVDDLLKLSRLMRHEMRRERVTLSVLAQEIAASLQATQPERQVEFVIKPGLVATGDAYLLRVVLEHLLGNAWKFTSARACARIEFDYTRVGDRLAYFVRDDGIGFDMAYADRLFDAFQRLHTTTEFEGTGIGLAIVQRIIRRHGGQVWAEGTVGQGATFYFTLLSDGS
jgi:signal transduction histidine kinase